MARKPLGPLAALPAVLLLVGCTPAVPASAPSSAPSAAPAASATTAPLPSSEPAAAPSAAPPTREPGPVATATASLPYCGDEFVRAQWATSGWSWGGTADEELAQAAPSPSFELGGLIAEHEVVCAATYRHPTDGERGYADTSVAILRGGDATGAAIEAWAQANGWDAGDQHGIRGAEGSMDAKLFWHVIPLDEVPIGSDEAAVALAGAEPGDVIVSVFDWR